MNKAFLRHINDEITFMQKQAEGLTFEMLMENEVLQRAFARSLEIIGEAVKNLPDDFKKEHSDIEWNKIAGLRDKLIHHYFGIDWLIIWDVLENKLPDLEKKIEGLLEES